MKRCTGILAIAFVQLILQVSWANSQPPNHLWSQGFGSTNLDESESIAVDGSGNVFVTGQFQGTADFGGGNLASAGSWDIFLAKYDANGSHLWSQRFGSTAEDAGYSVAVDGSGNVFVTGRFKGTVNFGGGNLTTPGNSNIFLAKYDANGNHVWSQGFGSTGGDIGYSVAVDGSGNVLLTGEFQGTVDFGGGNLASAGSWDVVLAKYDASGSHLWSQRFGGTSNDGGRSVVVDGLGNVFVTGHFWGTANFGGGNLVSAGAFDIFLAKYDASGSHLWSQRFGSTNHDDSFAVAVDGSGDVIVTGEFQETVDFGGGNLASAGAHDVFLAKYDASGSHVWSKRFGNTNDDRGHSVTADGSGDVIVTGYFQGTVDFGGGNLVSAGAFDFFLARYNANGTHMWSRRFGSTGIESGLSVALDGSWNVLVTGYFEGTVDFGGGNLVSTGSTDIFLAAYDGAVPFTDVTTPPLDRSAVGRGVAWGDFDNDGNLDLYLSDNNSTNALLQYQGNGVFVDVTTSAGVGNADHGAGVAWADYDNDGYLDLYLSNQLNDANVLFHNEHDSTFTDATSGPLADPYLGWSMAWGDYDNDGYVDLYQVDAIDGNKLFHNEGDGTFTNATAGSGLGSSAPSGRCGVWGDYDNDGHLDLYVVNADHPNRLFHNDGDGTFSNASSGSGVVEGTNCRSAAWGDYDNDGYLDLYLVKSIGNKLYHNNSGDGTFTEVGDSLGVADMGDGRGVAWGDYDNDGYLDLYVSNLNGANKLFHNDGAVAFSNTADALLAGYSNSDGVAWADYDKDGDLDLYLANEGPETNKLFRNELSNGNHWLHVDLVGTYSNRAAIGERIRVVAGGMGQIREISGGSGFFSQNSLTAEFGLGAATIVDTIEVEWFSGVVDRIVGQSPDQLVTLTETPPYASIASVADVPDDQGGWVRIYFTRSGFDRVDESSTPIATYAVHRRVDNAALVATILEHGAEVGEVDVAGGDEWKQIAPPKERGKLVRFDERYFLVANSANAAAPPGIWEVVGTVPAQQDEQYIFLSPTVADSSATIPYSVYYVSAHTTTPSIYYDSPPDSGYSVDNIAPGVPQGFAVAYSTGSGNQLSWDAAPEPDFQYHRVYRDTDPNFTPGSGNLVHSTSATNWADPDFDDGSVSYKITTVDHAGNESDPASPGLVTDAEPAIPERFALHLNIPNPFNPTTIIRYDVPASGGHVTIRIYDVSGRLVRELVDVKQTPGAKSVEWNGRNTSGATVASGVYFYRMQAPGYNQTRKMVLLR